MQISCKIDLSQTQHLAKSLFIETSFTGFGASKGSATREKEAFRRGKTGHFCGKQGKRSLFVANETHCFPHFPHSMSFYLLVLLRPLEPGADPRLALPIPSPRSTTPSYAH